MERKKNKAAKGKQKKNNFEINTGQIFLGLSDTEDRNWENYNRKFLRIVVQEEIQKALIKKNIYTVKFDGENGKYLDGHRKNRYPLDLEEAKNKDNFPFPDYFLMPDKESKHYSIINYDEDCVINKGEYNFDLFFALQFSLTSIVKGDILEADKFLKYHLVHSFKRDLKKYKLFLDRICLKYREFLKEKYEPLAKQFINILEHSNMEPNKLKQKPDSLNKIKISWTGQSNSLVHLFRQLKIKTNKKGLPLISNSYEEIGFFIKENFTEFNEVEHSTIVRQLYLNEKPKKATKKIEIYV